MRISLLDLGRILTGSKAAHDDVVNGNHRHILVKGRVVSGGGASVSGVVDMLVSVVGDGIVINVCVNAGNVLDSCILCIAVVLFRAVEKNVSKWQDGIKCQRWNQRLAGTHKSMNMEESSS